MAELVDNEETEHPAFHFRIYMQIFKISKIHGTMELVVVLKIS